MFTRNFEESYYCNKFDERNFEMSLECKTEVITDKWAGYIFYEIAFILTALAIITATILATIFMGDEWLLLTLTWFVIIPLTYALLGWAQYAIFEKRNKEALHNIKLKYKNIEEQEERRFELYKKLYPLEWLCKKSGVKSPYETAMLIRYLNLDKNTKA